MDGEIDLELFTIAIIQLNNAFQKLNNNDTDIKESLDSSYENLKELSDSLESIINYEEINATEVEPFFTYSLNIFPEYKAQLANLENLDDNLNESVINLIEVFDKLYKIADEYFKNRGVTVWNMI